MVGNKEMLVTDLFVVKHHCESEKDREVLDWAIKYFQKNLISPENYEAQYPECCNDPWPNPYVGKECFVISDSCRSAYCCWASSQDLQFL